MNQSVIDAMAAAVRAAPDNVALRAHLAGLLVEADRFSEAWDHAVAGLALEPANVDLLAAAAASGPKSGHETEAAGYQRLLDALVDDAAAPSAAASSPPTDHAAPAAQPGHDAPADGTREAGEIDDEVEVAGPAVDESALAQVAASAPDSVDELFDLWEEADAPPEPEIGELSRDRLLLADVGGMDDVKDRLRTSFLNPMRNPEIQRAYGKKMRGGLLLWGPPGCGKTFIAKAVAGELDANFYAVGLSDVLDMYLGQSERNLTSIFEIARRNAPCVLFLDEVDALGQKRTHLRGGGGAMRNVVNQLLQELDGAKAENEGVFVLAATNHPWDIDAALLRPGRLDRSLLVLPPDRPAREAIFGLHLRDRPTDKLKLSWCAKHTENLTGADIALICEQATELAMEESIAAGSIVPITMSHLRSAMAEIKPSYKQWAELARNYATFNNETGEYDELLHWLKRQRLA